MKIRVSEARISGIFAKRESFYAKLTGLGLDAL